MRTRVKVCCIASVAEAQIAINAGADALGLVGPMPSGPGTLEDAAIAAIAQATPPPISRFLLTSETQVTSIIAHARFCRTDTVQLVDAVPPEAYAALRDSLPGVRLVQVLHVEGKAQLAEARVYADLADALLLDSGRPNAATRELGGTGRTHDWEVSRAIVAAVECPVFLAGGLNANNVGEAIRQVQPFGVDLCSKVRTNEQLDPIKLRAFIKAVHEA